MTDPDARRPDAAPEPLDALFLSYFEDVDRWHNDGLPGTPTGSRAERIALGDEGGHGVLARTARQAVSVEGGVHDVARFFSLAAAGDTSQHRRYDAFSLTHLVGKYYESLAARHGRRVVHQNHVSRVELAELARRYRPRYVMLSSTFMIENATVVDAVQHVRRAFPDVPIVMGGLFLVELQKAVPERLFPMLLASFGADAYVITPLGEAAFLRLLEHDGPLDGVDLPGGWVRRGKRFEPCPGDDVQRPIDDDWVRWDELDPAGLYRTVHTRTARSCAFVCSFCSYPANQGPLTTQQPETLDLELQRLGRVPGVRSLIFTDDTFNVPAPRFKELCRVLARHEVTWYSFFRCQFADEETVQLMRDSGCGGVFLGIESLDDRVLKNMRKAATKKAFARGVELLKRAGIPMHANFIIGFPGDVTANTQGFLDFVDDHGIEFYYATPWFCSPATPIAREKERFGIEGDFHRWTHDTMTVDEAMELEEYSIDRAKESVWMTELGGRNFWSEVLFYGGGLSVPETQRAVRTFNRFLRGDHRRADLAADPEFRWLGERLRAADFPEPPGFEAYRAACLRAEGAGA